MDSFLTALGNVFSLHVLAIIFLSASYGIFVGAIPGLTATMAVALLVPVTFFLDDTSALAAIVTLEACAIFSGDIPTTLVRIPGTPSSAAYTDDAYSLTKAGRQEDSLGVSLIFSVTGGLFGALILIAFAPLAARVALEFTTYEYFWLTLLGLSCAALVSRGSALKGVLALVIGLLFSMVGLSAVHSAPRFTMGRDELIEGINFIPAMIGLFGVSEVLRNVMSPDEGHAPNAASSVRPRVRILGALGQSLHAVFGPAFALLRRRKLTALRSGAIGTFVGMLPGAGADIAAWISYAVSKRFSKTPDAYGSGSLEGVGDATSANNSALAGAWIPSLVFGIPGDSVTAIVIGVLLMKNVTPGPEIFEKQGALVHSIYITFIVANLLLLPIGFVAIRAGSAIVRVPKRVLLPCILLFCIVGAYAISGSYFDVAVMLGMGILGFVLEAYGVPLGPVVLGIILGDKLEQYFIQNLTKSESLLSFFARPWAAVLGGLCLVLWGSSVLVAVRRRLRRERGIN